MNKKAGFLSIKYIADNVWGVIRNEIVPIKHGRVAKFWQPIIADYFEGKIDKSLLKPKKQIAGKIIWQYWGQQSDGNLALPETVQRCFASVDKYKDDYHVIRLNDKTVSEYLDFPEFIWNNDGEYKFSRVFFSDLLRLALLHVYGGVWLDATILLTAPLPKEFSEHDYFVFQRSDDEPNKSFWAGPHTSYWSWNKRYRVKMLNSVIFANKNSLMINVMLDLILHYWKTQHKIINYFFFQILYNELINGQLKNQQCMVVSDTLPHLMRVLVDGHDYIPLSKLLEVVNIHKLTYFDENKIAKLDELIAQAEQLDKS